MNIKSQEVSLCVNMAATDRLQISTIWARTKSASTSLLPTILYFFLMTKKSLILMFDLLNE